MPEKKYQDKNWLKEQYVKLNRKVKDIARECGVNIITIGRWRKRFGIPSRKFSTEAIEMMSKNRKGKNTGEDNPNWKGEEVGYKCLHEWIRKYKKKPESCQKCGKKQDYLEIANISGKYKRDIDDYVFLCVKCHKEFDNNLHPFIKSGINTRFTKGNIPWNKNLPAKMQPNYGKKHSKESIERMKIARKNFWNKKKSEEVNAY